MDNINEYYGLKDLIGVRISEHDYFMLIAKLVALRSTCLNRKVGCIIVKDKRIIATGYNGQFSGSIHCTDLGYCSKKQFGKKHYCRAVHAEANAIAQAAKYGISLNDSIMYITCFPCSECLKLIVSSGIKKVYYEINYYKEDEDFYYWVKQSPIHLEQYVLSEEIWNLNFNDILKNPISVKSKELLKQNNDFKKNKTSTNKLNNILNKNKQQNIDNLISLQKEFDIILDELNNIICDDLIEE